MSFKSLMLDEPILRALEKKGYTTPTEIQQKCIPLILQRKDILASAQTGTGKTAAFTLPMIQILATNDRLQKSQRPRLRALILTPTRELAAQIAENIEHYKQFMPLRQTSIFGGVSQHSQVQEIRNGVDILIATPGRLKDLLNQRLVNLSQIEYFVLDEADRMLDSGFLEDIKKIIAYLPAKKQTLLFSATVPPPIRKLAHQLLTDAANVQVEAPSSTSEKIHQRVYHVEKHNKHDLLVNLLRNKDIDRVLIFTTMKHHADKIARRLTSSGIGSAAIHGNRTQSQRERALEKFKLRQVKALVATDVVARGIDIDDLTHVINYELPDVPETYVHRIGRTGRKGRSGIAISFCSSEETPQLKQIQQLISEKLQVMSLHGANQNSN